MKRGDIKRPPPLQKLLSQLRKNTSVVLQISASLVFILCHSVAAAQDASPDAVLEAIKQLQMQLEAQNKKIDEQAEQIESQRMAIRALQQQLDGSEVLAVNQSTPNDDKAMRSRLETIEESIKLSQEAESTQYDLTSFPGSIAIPGTSSAIRLGGFVKMNSVTSFDPIATNDRFIVGSIPVPQQDGTTSSSLTVSQSRLNIDLRDNAEYGSLRAFLEADFAGAGDTFRLRHAFGQYKNILIGKTWTAFMDTRLKIEDLDFEGINGQIILRQPQVRYFPKIGQNSNLLISLEDPGGRISGGKGKGIYPDLIVSMEHSLPDDWHAKISLLLRRMSGTCDNCLKGDTDEATAWALSVSGTKQVPWWDERDNIQIQFSYGEGYSHYINDLGSTRQADAYFDEETSELIPVPAFAMYVAMQKWWTPTIRSNLNYGFVKVDNDGAFNFDDYKKTNRIAGNIVWSPIPRIDMGAELLFGTRTNQNNDDADATQLQISAKYRY